ncbi:MAG: N-6 DNA methylase, partial [Chloroflexi bacterium]|nr:N-6 DNA methylase [Chloroflexota bacterium]
PPPPEVRDVDREALALRTPGDLHAQLLKDNHQRGVYYTPAALAEPTARLTLEPLLTDIERLPRVLDPAMGGGSLLLAAGEVMAGWLVTQGMAEMDARQQAVQRLFGLDHDAFAVRLAGLMLRRWAGLAPGSLITADTLLGSPLLPGRFDAVVGNPPYASVFTRARAEDWKRYKHRIKKRYRSAVGSFDLSVPFVEYSLAMLRAGGRCGLVLSNKLLGAAYAEQLRAIVEQEATVSMLIEADNAFRVDIYPHIWILEKTPPAPDEPVRVITGSSAHTHTQADLHGHLWSGALSPDWARLRTRFGGLPRLRDVAVVTAGMTVDESYRADAVTQDGEPGPNHARLITAGLIRRGEMLWGRKMCRFHRRDYRRPVVPLEALSPRRRAQAHRPKIIVAGLAKRIRAVVDDGPSVGTSGTVVITDSAVPLVDLCAWLNSDELDTWVQAVYRALSLANGYKRFGKREIGDLPLAAHLTAQDT